MGRCTKTGFSSYKESGFEWNVKSRSQRTHSKPVNPKFGTRVPRTRGDRPKLGKKMGRQTETTFSSFKESGFD